MLEQKLIDLKKELISYCETIKEMIKKSIDGLQNKDENILNEVIQDLENKSNIKEVEIEAIATNLIALYQPEAKDLRTIIAIIKINNDLERIGDSAVNISESALFLLREKLPVEINMLEKIEKEIINVYCESFNAFINEDLNSAMKVLKEEKKVDFMEKSIIDFFTEFITKNPQMAKIGMHIIRIAHNIERIGDLCTNICEEVVYIVMGRIIRHKFTLKEFLQKRKENISKSEK